MWQVDNEGGIACLWNIRIFFSSSSKNRRCLWAFEINHLCPVITIRRHLRSHILNQGRVGTGYLGSVIAKHRWPVLRKGLRYPQVVHQFPSAAECAYCPHLEPDS